MNIILLGPPGAGKGTQAAYIVKKINVPQISTGNILREAVANKTEYGLKAQEYMNRGDLVTDEIVIGIIRDRIQESDCQNGYILDGFPRNKEQSIALDSMLQEFGHSIDRVFDFRVSEENLLKRLLGRLNCSNTSCGAGYHEEFKKPKVKGKCDACGSDLFRRADDNKETILNRNKVYEETAGPIRDHYSEILIAIDSDKEISEINATLDKHL
ncbi:MAG: adenylate kinase [Nitrospinae bacterium]|nr:adenylate kinase [Nitrospinota bacterium]